MKSINLKWKISITLTLIVLIIMSIVVFSTYIFTKNMIMEQIDEKINIIKLSQKNNLNNLINKTEKQLSIFAKNKELQEFINSMNNINKEKLDEIINGYGYQSMMIVGRSKLLAEQLTYLENTLFSYITDSKGTVLADSRLKNINNLKKYIGKKLNNNEYKETSIENIKIDNNNNNYILFKQNFSNSNDKNIDGYYVIAIDLKIFGNNMESTYNIGGQTYLLNKDSYIFNHNNKELIGKKMDNIWFQKQLENDINKSKRIENGNYETIEK